MLVLILIFSILVYYIGEGITEGYTFASPSRKKHNNLIKSNAYTYGNGALGYHAWRWVENAGILGAFIAIFFLDISLLRLMMIIVGSAIFSWLPYQMCLWHVTENKLLIPGTVYMVGPFMINRPIWLFPVFGIAGLIIMISSFFV
jgi:hypothetical protein